MKHTNQEDSGRNQTEQQISQRKANKGQNGEEMNPWISRMFNPVAPGIIPVNTEWRCFKLAKG